MFAQRRALSLSLAHFPSPSRLLLSGSLLPLATISCAGEDGKLFAGAGIACDGIPRVGLKIAYPYNAIVS